MTKQPPKAGGTSLSAFSNLLRNVEGTLGDTCADGRPRFELQRRMPDGSTRRAEDGDIAAANLQAKIKQAAELVAALSPEQKVKWAEDQRKEGNELYSKKDYEAAMETYIVCLVASEGESKDQIKLPVLLNLAQCTLQLKQFKKTEHFCNIALEEMPVVAKSNPKVYFRRGRSRMLRGFYESAREDLEKALELAKSSNNNNSETEVKSIKKEIDKLSKLDKEGKRNETKQAVAMKQVLGGQKPAAPETKPKEVTSSAAKISEDGLYKDVRKRRTHSTLRAGSHEGNSRLREDTEIEFSISAYVEWYFRMMNVVSLKLKRMLWKSKP